MTEIQEISFGDFNESGFDSFNLKSAATNPTTVGSLSMNSSEENSSSPSDKQKKKKKKKKSDRSEKSGKSSRSSSRRNSASSEKERELIAKMTAEGFDNDDFGDFGDFEEPSFGEEIQSEGDSGSRRSGLSHKTPLTTDMTTASRRTGFSAFTGGASSPKTAIQVDGVMVQFPDEDFFSPEHQPDFDDLEEDNDSVISELSGLTGVFSAVDMVEESREQEEYLRSTRRPSMGQSTHAPPAITVSANVEMAPQRQKKGTKKSLSFSTVTIRSYERVLTENPATIKGVSIGIGWRYSAKPEMDVEKYEILRGPPRPSGALVLGPDVREAMLLELGYTRKDLACALRSINKSRNQRRQTVQNLAAEKVEEAFEGAGKRVKRMLNPFKKK